jgi:MPBQ/MSBQ methyltransferase
MPDRVAEAVQSHYGRSDLGAVILAALAGAGKDQLHVRGRAATLELARAAGLDATKRVLDVGCGVGGTSRCLATEFGCRVTGIDLTEEYCRAAAMLTDRVGLAHLVDHRQGDATRLPFDDRAFDVVWTEHVAMNIPDKPRLYEELHRVLEPGGTLAIYDVLAGPSAPVLFPVPWARTPDTSFLVRPHELRELLEAAGFTVSDWSDATEAGRAWFASQGAKIGKEGLPPLGIHVVLGGDFQAMAQNVVRNLLGGRIVLGQVIATK